jgi:hydroxylaminobenzene mutase
VEVQKRSRQILRHALALILCGLVWGAIVPHTPYPRLALTAHIQFMVNGLLFVVMAVLLHAIPNKVGPRSAFIMLMAVWLTWIMLASEVGNAWWGTKEILPLAAEQAGAEGGTEAQELAVALAHIISSVGLIAAWSLLVAGFWGRATEATVAQLPSGEAK